MSDTSFSRPNSEDLWVAAVATLSQEDKANIDITCQDRLQTITATLKLTEDAKNKCREKGWRFKRKSGETVVVRDVLAKVARWINEFKAIGDTIIQYDPAHAAIPWAGVRFVLQVCVNYFDTHEFLLENITSITEQMCRCQLIEKHLMGSPSFVVDELKRALVILYANILTYLAQVKAYFSKNTGRQFLEGLRRSPEQFKASFKAITHAQSDVEHWSQNANLQELKDGLARLGEPMIRWSDELTKIKDGLEKHERTKILCWISNEPYRLYHKREREGFMKGSGEWLLTHPVFRRWKDESASSLLWLRGIPGSGKSKLTSFVIENAQVAFRYQQAPPPAYFYCSRNPAEPARSDPHKILASIVRQLSSLGPETPLLNPGIEVYKSNEEDGFAAGSLQLGESFDLLIEILKEYPTATIILDALDECDAQTRQDLLHYLERVIRESSALVKIFISSRDDHDIVYKLQTYPALELSSNLNADDINHYVEHETRSLIDRGKLLSLITKPGEKDELCQTISYEVSNKAQGMFRWASLQLEALCKLKTRQAILERLGRLPPKLEDLYQELLNEIQHYDAESDRRYARHALSCLLCIQRRLGCDRFLMMVSATADSSSDLLSKDQVLELCRNLIVYDASADLFRFAHLSVREFLESKPEYAVAETNRIAAQFCLTTLMDNRLQDKHILNYVNENLTMHCRLGSIEKESPVGELLWEFLSNTASNSPVYRWVSRRIQDRWFTPSDHASIFSEAGDVRILSVACVFGLVGIAKFVVEQRPNVSDRSMNKCAALSLRHKSYEIFRILLSSRRIVITRVLFIFYLQHERIIASLPGIWDQVEITANILDEGPVLLVYEKGGQPINVRMSIDAFAGNLYLDGDRILKALLENEGVRVKITGDVFKTTRVNSVRGDTLMKLLLKKGGVQLEVTQDVLKAAAGNERQGSAIFGLLLEKKGDQLEVTQDLLKAAAGNIFQGSAIFGLLLEKGGDQLEVTQDLLKAAAGNKYEGSAIFGLLLEKKVQFEVTQDLLKAAAGNKFQGSAIFGLLLEKGGDQLEVTQDLLKAAAGNKYEGSKIFGLLLEKGGDQLEVTQDVLEAAARNTRQGSAILGLLDKRGDQVKITADIIHIAERN